MSGFEITSSTPSSRHMRARRHIAIVGTFNTGKTTRLATLAVSALSQGVTVVVIDSATEHEEKSLLSKLMWVSSKIVIRSPDNVMDIRQSWQCSNTDYPSDVLRESSSVTQLYLFDVSKYLELDYHLPPLERGTLRPYYQWFSLQCLQSVVQTLSGVKTLILLDEIELLPDFRHAFEIMHDMDTNIICAVHNQSELAELDSFFDIQFLTD